ncbi:MAG TPA: hypothetical protein VJ783_11500, partial [Pirellulales bacterium]|nr:hypothetical protein [Pirellulales bacterium]
MTNYQSPMNDFERLNQPPRTRPNRAVLWIALTMLALSGALLVLIGGAVAFYFFARSRIAAPPPRPAESEAQKRREVTEAFTASAAGEKPDELREFRRLISRAVRLTPADDTDAYFDFDRMVAEVKVATANRAVFESRDFIRGVKQGLAKQMAQAGPLAQYHRVEIKRVKHFGSDEAVLYSRHRDDDGDSIKMRWWLARHNGRWRAYDYENLGIGTRITTGMAAIADSIQGGALDARLEQAVQTCQGIWQLLGQENYDAAAQSLASIADIPLPPALEPVREVQWAMVCLARGEFPEALAHLARAEAIQPEMPTVVMLRASALNGLGRYEEALADAQKYLNLLGDDDTGYFLLGTALAGLGRRQEAADAFRRGLDDYSDSADNMTGLASVLPDDGLDELAQRFAAFKKPATRFAPIADELLANGQLAALAVIVAKHRELAPRDPRNDFYDGKIHEQRQEYDQAAELFRRALAAASDEQKTAFSTALIDTLLAAGKPLEAYSAVPDAATFFKIANQLIKEKQPDALDELIGLYSPDHADDSWLPYFRGAVLILRGDYEQAAATMRPMLDKDFPDEQRKSYWGQFSGCMALAGKTVEGYRACPDARYAFEYLGDFHVNRGEYDPLEKLIAAHKAADGRDMWIPYYEATLLVGQGKPEAAAALLKPLLHAAAEPEKLGSYANVYLQAMVNAGKPLEAYQAVPEAHNAFLTAANRLLADRDPAKLDQLVTLHEQRNPDDGWLPYFRAEALLIRGALAEAAAVFESASAKVVDDQRQSYLDEYLWCMSQLGGPLEAYRAAPDAAAAFRRLAGWLDDFDRRAALARLLAAHAERAPDDPWLVYNRARLLALKGRFAEVADTLEPLLDTDDEKLSDRCFYQYEWAVSQAGRPLDLYRHWPDSGRAFASTAYDLSGADPPNSEALAELIALHEAKQPDDPWLKFYQCKLLVLRGDHAEAAAAARPLMDDQDNAALARMASGVYFDAAVASGKTDEAYQAAPDQRGAFASMAYRLFSESKFDGLERLITLHGKHHADDIWLDSYRARLLEARGKPDEAIEVLQSRIARLEDESDKRTLAYDLVERLLRAGRPLEAYEAYPSIGFFSVANAFVEKKDSEQLFKLVAAHRSRQPDDVWLDYYEGEARRLTGDFDRADASFAAGIAKLRGADDDSETLEDYRLARRAARLEADQIIRAYREGGNLHDSFLALLGHCRQTRNGELLEQLVEARRADEPRDYMLPEAEVEASLLRHDYEAAVKRLLAHRAELEPRGIKHFEH